MTPMDGIMNWIKLTCMWSKNWTSLALIVYYSKLSTIQAQMGWMKITSIESISIDELWFQGFG